jgi:hypothetical protein
MNDGEPEPLEISTDLYVSEGVSVMSAEFIGFDTWLAWALSSVLEDFNESRGFLSREGFPERGQ